MVSDVKKLSSGEQRECSKILATNCPVHIMGLSEEIEKTIAQAIHFPRLRFIDLYASVGCPI